MICHLLRDLASGSVPIAIICIALLPAIGKTTETPGAAQKIPWDKGGMDSAIEGRIEKAVTRAIKKRELSGCVVLIGRREGIVFEHVYGNRAVKPKVEPMTIDTLLDMASLTKPLATATSIMILIE